MTDLTLPDLIAILWFAACWLGYTHLADHSRLHKRSVSAAMSDYRHRWMREMLKRENRIVDTQALGNLLNGAAFFASSTILAIGGLFALLGATEKAIELAESWPFALPVSRFAWEMKVMLLLIIFVYAFFKFVWAYRLFNYCSVLIAAAPVDWQDDPTAEEIAERAARVNDLAAGHFNRGLRAFFFTLAALTWFLHPFVFMAVTAWVVRVLYRREFRSRSLAAIRDSL